MSKAFRKAWRSEFNFDFCFAGRASGFNLARAHGNMLEPGGLVQSTMVTSRAKVNREAGPPMTLQSSSWSHSESAQPRQEGEEGSRTRGARRGGSATRAGEPAAGHSGVPPVPGGSARKSTATAAEGSPQSPQDRQGAAALAAALAAFFRAVLEGSSGCSMAHCAPKVQVPLRKSGHTPEAGAPGLAARLALVTFQAS
jgi:hypothetical protein